jgi:hypothetical protein
MRIAIKKRRNMRTTWQDLMMQSRFHAGRMISERAKEK